MIRVSALSKMYYIGSEKVTALDNANLHIPKGEFISIIGSSGSGKSTLMNILGCLDRPSSGTYFLNGRNVLLLKKNELAAVRNKEIGFIFQGFNLLENMTALQNVELPLIYAGVSAPIRREKALFALERVGLSKRVRHHPFELSGGQQQRVAIARAITQHPSVILADEPTGNLDRKSSDDVLALLSELHKEGSTIVLITHDDKVANRAQRVIEISDGKIINN